MKLYKRTPAGRISKPQPVQITIMQVSQFDGAVTLQAGNLTMRLDRSEVERVAGAAGMVDANTVMANLRGLAAQLAAN